MKISQFWLFLILIFLANWISDINSCVSFGFLKSEFPFTSEKPIKGKVDNMKNFHWKCCSYSWWSRQIYGFPAYFRSNSLWKNLRKILIDSKEPPSKFEFHGDSWIGYFYFRLHGMASNHLKHPFGFLNPKKTQLLKYITKESFWKKRRFI